MYDTWWGMLLPGLMSTSSSLLMRQFFQTLPSELEDAARVDGASEWRSYWKIMLPMALPGVVTTFMLQFMGAWNELAWPQMIITSSSMRTLAVGLAYISQVVAYGQFGAAEHIPMAWAQAGAVTLALPIILVFTLGQRWFVRGIALTGIR